MGVTDDAGKTRVEPGDPGPKSKIHGDQGMYTNARSADGGQNAPQPIIDPDEPYNTSSGSGRKGKQGTTVIGAGTTQEEVSVDEVTNAVAHPPTDAFDPETASLHPAGDTKTTTADDMIDASDAVAAGQSHPAETDAFGALIAAQVPEHLRVVDVRRRTGARDTSISGVAQVGNTVVARIGGVDRYDKVWLRVKGPDTDSRVRCAHEGDSASQAVMITRPGTYVIGFEVDTHLVGEIEFTV